MKERKIAVIGDPGSVMIFKAIGLDVYYEEQGPMIEKRIHLHHRRSRPAGTRSN